MPWMLVEDAGEMNDMTDTANSNTAHAGLPSRFRPHKSGNSEWDYSMGN
jgi:hypothetical protein